MRLRTRIPPDRRSVRIILGTALSALFLVQPAAAQPAEDCTVPPDLQPLIDLLNTIGELAFIAGIALATVGFSVAGLMFMMPGQEYARRGKQVAKNVFIGTIILLSANMVVSFLTSQLGTSLCT
jgi:hypothetical protein